MRTTRATTFLLAISIVASLFAAARGQENIRLDNETVAVVPSPWKLMTVDTKASLRGLHVLSETDIWASGSGGTLINSIDGGQTWRVQIVPGAEELDFRDIHAIDEGTIVAITSGTPARIYRSTNGGLGWKVRYENDDQRVFLDALSFWDDREGIVMGDPIDNRLFLLQTSDGGSTWSQHPRVPRTLPGEAGFAASGTNMISLGKRTLMIGLGSAAKGDSKESSRVLISLDGGGTWSAASVPIRRSASAGIFSLCFANADDGVAVGGNFEKADSKASNFAITRDGGKTWTTPEKKREPPSGYRSCVAMWVNGKEVQLVTVGPNGTDLSGDLGEKWHRVSNEGFHSIDFSPDGKHGWATGTDGRVAKWIGIAKVKPIKKSETIRMGPIKKLPQTK